MDQIEGLLPPKECQQNKTVSSCEQLIENMTNKPAIVTMNGSKCGYSPQKDAIFMVNKNQFESLFEYYHVLFHELIHATGHQSRLNRNTITKKNSFGSPKYALEELTAEIGANYLSNLANIQKEIAFDQSVSYINNWKSVIQNQPNAVVTASQRAQKAIHYIQNN